MKKPKRLTWQDFDFGDETKEEIKANHCNFAKLVESHNNLIEVINYLWDHIQSTNPELIDLSEE